MASKKVTSESYVPFTNQFTLPPQQLQLPISQPSLPGIPAPNFPSPVPNAQGPMIFPGQNAQPMQLPPQILSQQQFQQLMQQQQMQQQQQQQMQQQPQQFINQQPPPFLPPNQQTLTPPAYPMIPQQQPSVNMTDPLLTRDIVLLYCPQKVGSTSVVTSIRMSAPDKFFVMHTHDEIIFRSNGGNGNNVCVSDIIKNTAVKNQVTNTPRNVYLIDIYRTPMERKISEFFHEIGIYHFNNLEQNIAKYNLNKITKRFNDIFPHISNEDYYKERFHLDFDYEEFDFQNKYIMTEKEGVKYIKLRLKDSAEWGHILSGILDADITVVTDYETREKEIGEVYKKFMESYQLPYNYFKMIENCPQLKCYYDFGDRYDYLNKWWKRTTGLYTSFTLEQYNFYKALYLDNQFYFRKLTNHYKDDGCLCDNCKAKRERILAQVKREGDKNYDANYHNVPENAAMKSNNTVLIKMFNEESVNQDKHLVLSLIP